MALVSVSVLSFFMLSCLNLGFVSKYVVATRHKPHNVSFPSVIAFGDSIVDTVSFPSVIFFGDSIVDTGNNNHLETIAKANFPPYGRDFMGGKPTGRFSNGKVPSDLIVEELGIKGTLPAYLDPNLRDQDLLTGVNFASGGGGFDPLTSELSNILSLSDQLVLFKDYLSRLTQIAGVDKTAAVLNNGLFFVVTGSNDITNTYFSTPFRKTLYDVPAYTDFMLSYASSFIQDLYGLGARRIGILSLPPIGCVPSQRTLKGGLERQCVENYNEMVQLFNSKLIAEVKNLNIQYPDARIAYADIYNPLLDLIYNPRKYGFNIGNVGCCGTGKIEVVFLCKYTCSNVNDYVFWDSFHLTEKAYRVLVQEVLKKYLHSLI